MARKNDKTQKNDVQEMRPTSETVQNESPFVGWPNFDVFWSDCVKGVGTPTIKSACIAHLKALGVWEDQSHWIDGLIDYGIPIEKE